MRTPINVGHRRKYSQHRVFTITNANTEMEKRDYMQWASFLVSTNPTTV